MYSSPIISPDLDINLGDSGTFYFCKEQSNCFAAISLVPLLFCAYYNLQLIPSIVSFFQRDMTDRLITHHDHKMYVFGGIDDI